MGTQLSRLARASSIASLWLSALLAAPGWVVGVLGLTDGIGPTGLAGLTEMAGFVFSGWTVFRSIRMLLREFFDAPLARTGCLVAAVALACGFFLLMSVIGLEANVDHKRAFTTALQLLGYFGLALLVVRVALWSWPRLKAA
jgi:hypothetical protein